MLLLVTVGSAAPIGSGAHPDHLWRERQPGDPSVPQFAPPTSLAPLIRAVRSTVVNVSTGEAETSPVPFDRESSTLGSGVIISSDGHVLTNSHVVEKDKPIRLKLADGREFSAEIVGRDPSSDVALLKVAGHASADLPFAYLGDSDKLQVGDWVLAIGTPFGLEQSVSQGIISAKERVLGVGAFDDFLQTDALINPGNSGGPLFNMRGEVVGINTAVISGGQGIGFAVPINMVKDLLPNLQVNGKLARGWLGVNIQERPTGTDPLHKGAVITEVFRASPAEVAGLKPGDHVLAVNGHAAESYLQLLRRISTLAPGSHVKLSVQRGMTMKEITVTLGIRPTREPPTSEVVAPQADKLGLVVKELSEPVASGLKVQPFSGVLVSRVIPGSPAERAGLQAGDLIDEINRKRVQDIQSMKAALSVSGVDQDVLLRLRRGDGSRYVAIKPRPQ